MKDKNCESTTKKRISKKLKLPHSVVKNATTSIVFSFSFKRIRLVVVPKSSGFNCQEGNNVSGRLKHCLVIVNCQICQQSNIRKQFTFKLKRNMNLGLLPLATAHYANNIRLKNLVERHFFQLKLFP